MAGLRASIAEHTAAIAADDEQAIIAADRAFHRALLTAAHNPAPRPRARPAAGARPVAMLSGDLSRWPRKALAEHKTILAAIRAGDPGAADRAARDHVAAVLARHLTRA
ncbi:FCD domain-containing protein [Nocardioides sp. B-3]|nr:FCD domain-containing protein [Nocardioides sp. B-3]